MTNRYVCLLLLIAVIAFPVVAQDAAAAGASAAASGQAAAPGQTTSSRPAPTNLKALPKTMTGDEVWARMVEYQGDLGVGCEFCHAQSANRRLDYVSDANPVKDTARYMISMTADLNDQYLENLPGRRYGDPITCGTCHRGASHPSVFEPKPKAE